MRSAAVIGLIVGTLVIPSTAYGGVAAFRFSVNLGSACQNGYGPANASITLRLKNSDGALVAVRTTTSDGSGYWYTSTCFPRSVETGDKIRATDGSVSRAFTVPPLTVRANRWSDRVSGRARHDTDFTLYAYNCPRIDSGCAQKAARTINVDGTGHWSTDFTSVWDANGQDYVYAWWTSAQGDVVYRYGYFAYVAVTLHDFSLWGYQIPVSSATVTLKNSSGGVRASAPVLANSSGYYTGKFLSGTWAPVNVHAGDKVQYSAGGSFTVPSMTVAGNSTTDRISGQCMPNRPFQVYAQDPDYARPQPYSYAGGKTDGTGHFSRDMSNSSYPTFDLMPGDTIQVTCLTGGGDRVILKGTAS